jgi:hypothetical protein
MLMCFVARITMCPTQSPQTATTRVESSRHCVVDLLTDSRNCLNTVLSAPIVNTHLQTEITAAQKLRLQMKGEPIRPVSFVGTCVGVWHTRTTSGSDPVRKLTTAHKVVQLHDQQQHVNNEPVRTYKRTQSSSTQRALDVDMQRVNATIQVK